MSDLERRFAEVRFDAETGRLTGIAVVYGDAAQIGRGTERIEPGTFTFRDPVLNLMHDRSRPVARVGAGLTLTDTAERLTVEVDFPDTPIAAEARALAAAGMLPGLSVEFRATSDTWEGTTRTIHKADLYGLALVDKPAYPASQVVSVRHADAQPARRRYGPW